MTCTRRLSITIVSALTHLILKNIFSVFRKKKKSEHEEHCTRCADMTGWCNDKYEVFQLMSAQTAQPPLVVQKAP